MMGYEMASAGLESSSLSTMRPAEGNTTMSNVTPSTDVISNACFSNFDTVACIRSSILAFLAVLTAVLCIWKIVRLHLARHQTCHQYFIFYCASLECVIGAVHFALSMYVQIDFVLQWLKLAQFLVMCHYYWTLATRALRREIWTKRILIPFLILACIYFTVVACLGIANVEPSFVECLEPYWLMMSSAEFIIVQLFCVAGFYITRRLNEISTLDSVRRAQKRDLWCIVIVFEISAFIGVLYDMSLQIAGDRSTGCSAIFNHMQSIYSPIFMTFMVGKLLLPIWVMLFVFQPTPPAMADQDDLIPPLTDDGPSAFTSSYEEQYRQLYHPAEDYRSFSNGVTPGVRRSQSNISISKRSGNSLAAISEERDSHSTSLQNPRVSNDNSTQCQKDTKESDSKMSRDESSTTSHITSASTISTSSKDTADDTKDKSNTTSAWGGLAKTGENTSVQVQNRRGLRAFPVQEDDSDDSSPQSPKGRGKFYI